MLPSWQRAGIGRGLVERLVNALLAEGVPVVSLFAEPRVVGLYQRLGFTQAPPTAPLPVPHTRHKRPVHPLTRPVFSKMCVYARPGVAGKEGALPPQSLEHPVKDAKDMQSRLVAVCLDPR